MRKYTRISESITIDKIKSAPIGSVIADLKRKVKIGSKVNNNTRADWELVLSIGVFDIGDEAVKSIFDRGNGKYQLLSPEGDIIYK